MSMKGCPNPSLYESLSSKLARDAGMDESEIYSEVRNVQTNSTAYLTDIAAIQIVARSHGVRL